MKRITHILTAVALLAIAQCAALAQLQYESTQLTYTNGVDATNTVSTDSAAINCTRADNLALQIQFVHAGAGTDDCVFTFKKSVDGTTYATIGGPTFTIAANGTNAVCLVTNWACEGVGYLKLDSVQNGVAEVMTNIAVYYSTKPRIRGSRN